MRYEDERELAFGDIRDEDTDSLFFESDESYGDYELDYDLEMGFNPYCGCYDYDC